MVSMSKCLQRCLLRNLLWWLTACLGFFLTVWFMSTGDMIASLYCSVIPFLVGSVVVVWTCYRGCRAAQQE